MTDTPTPPDIDDIIAARLGEALAGITSRLEEISDRVDAALEALGNRVAAIETTVLPAILARLEALEAGTPPPPDPPPPVDPPDPPPPPVDPPPPVTPIQKSEILVEVDADDPDTWAPKRTNETQLRANAKIYNFDNGGNDPGRDILGSNTRYNGRLEGWKMDDGDTVRAGLVQALGRDWWQFAGQFTGKGYNPDNPGALVVGPGANDPIWLDGSPRGDFARIEGHVRVGDGTTPGDVMTWWHLGIAEPWMWGDAHTAGPFGIHSPLNAAQSGPVTTSTRNGRIIWWSKTTGPSSAARGILSPLPFPGQQPLESDHIILGEYPLPEPGTPFGMVVIAQVDRSGRNPYRFELWDIPLNGAAPRLVTRYTGPPFGYYYGPRAKNAEFYPIVGSVYAPHKWWPPSKFPATPWNWDARTADGNVRRVRFRRSGAALNLDGSVIDRAADRVRRAWATAG